MPGTSDTAVCTEPTDPNGSVETRCEPTAPTGAVEPVDGTSRAEYVQQVLGTARATLARSRGNHEQFRERPADVTGVSERSRGRPLAPRDRTQPPQTPDTSIPTWEQEREAVFEAVRSLRELCETLSDQLAAIRWRQLGSVFDTPHAAYREMQQWRDEERARIEEESLERKRLKMGDDARHSNQPGPQAIRNNHNKNAGKAESDRIKK